MHAYEVAVKEGFHFGDYGDAMLIVDGYLQYWVFRIQQQEPEHHVAALVCIIIQICNVLFANMSFFLCKICLILRKIAILLFILKL